MNDIFNYHRRATVDVNVGGVMLGGKHSVKVQSMTNTNTDDIEASVAQCRRIADCGGDIVRLTAQGVKEAENIGRIAPHCVSRAAMCLLWPTFISIPRLRLPLRR